MNNDPHEDLKEWEKKENSWWTKFKKNVKPLWIFLFVASILLGNYLVASNSISKGLFFVVVISVGVLFLFIILKGNPKEKKLLPEHIIKQIVYEAFMRKKKEGIEIPFDAEIKVTLLSGAKYEQDFVSGTSGIVNRQVGVEVWKKSYKKSYTVSVEPYDGTILDIIPQPLGISSKNALVKDIKIVPAQFLEKS
ncbi:conserved hypothetical protein [Azospirillaceae bacterium]